MKKSITAIIMSLLLATTVIGFANTIQVVNKTMYYCDVDNFGQIHSCKQQANTTGTAIDVLDQQGNPVSSIAIGATGNAPVFPGPNSGEVQAKVQNGDNENNIFGFLTFDIQPNQNTYYIVTKDSSSGMYGLAATPNQP